MENKYIWFKKNDDLNSADVVHQILVFGTLEDIAEMKSKIGAVKIRRIFLDQPKKIYTRPELNFVKNYLLKIDKKISIDKYLQYTPRDISGGKHVIQGEKI
ncbi:MAG: hypothetical protein NTW79_03155 [Candidatus Berkelbacteria bacterium]|nr:hypothetical protein [Candidatus Berkelbacteria bacterium]